MSRNYRQSKSPSEEGLSHRTGNCCRHAHQRCVHEQAYTPSGGQSHGYHSHSSGGRTASQQVPEPACSDCQSHEKEIPKTSTLPRVLDYDSVSLDGEPPEFSPVHTPIESDSESVRPISFMPACRPSPSGRRPDESSTGEEDLNERQSTHVHWMPRPGSESGGDSPFYASRRSPRHHHPHARHHRQHHHYTQSHPYGWHGRPRAGSERRARSLERIFRGNNGMGVSVRTRSHSPRHIFVRGREYR